MLSAASGRVSFMEPARRQAGLSAGSKTEIGLSLIFWCQKSSKVGLLIYIDILLIICYNKFINCSFSINILILVAMELFEEITVLGLDFFKAKKGIRISKEEIEDATKICINVVKKIDKAADFVNKNQLAKPMLRGVSKISNIILFFCGFVFTSSVLILIFADSLIASILTLAIVMILCRLLAIVSAVVIAIVLLVGYAKLKSY